MAGDGGGADARFDRSAPPVPLSPIQPAYTADALQKRTAGDVSLILTVDEQGTVTHVEVEAGLPHGLTESAVAAARGARFRAALDASGRPFAVRLRWIVHFTLPEVRTPNAAGAAPPSTGPPSTPPAVPASAAPSAPLPPDVERVAAGPEGQLFIWVRERGTGKILPTASVYIEDVGELLRLNPQARATRTLPPGAYALVVRAPGHHQEERIERLHPGERLERTYFLEKTRLNEYETIVNAAPPRAETGVVTLQAEEIHTIPGTFGDPFRAAMLLPGVGSIISGIGYPVIRGEAPGQTGTFVDDVKVPLLYHLGFGPAVVHPLYLASLDFHPGTFPAEFGRFTGGLIRAKTTGAPAERQTMLEVDLFKFSGYHAQPFTWDGREGAVSVSARYGTFSFLAKAFDPTAVLEYWDYQTRADLRVGPGTLRLLVFGANDAAGTKRIIDENGDPQGKDEVLNIGFHRADLRYRFFRRGPFTGELGLEAGPDYTDSTGDPDDQNRDRVRLLEWIVRPRASGEAVLGSRFKLRAGADTLYQSWYVQLGQNTVDDVIFPRYALTFGAYLQGEWQPTPAWLIVPGVRVDHYNYHLHDRTILATSVDPRLAIRRRLRPGLFLKVGGGLYHSPPRFLLPWPGLEGFGLDNGLNRSIQASAGVEATLPGDITLDAQVYYNWLRRVTEFDIEDFGDEPTGTPNSTFVGRSYGLELIARRRLGHRLFGWFTYTLARAERNYPEAGWRPADFDQTQIINTVVSYALGRSWTVSGTFHYNSGRPVTPETFPAGSPPGTDPEPLRADRNRDRLPSFWRIDARIEKREAFDTWYLDFYVDWLNISLQQEITEYEYTRDPTSGMVRRRSRGPVFTLPTLGLRAVF